jgi:hypothetical protein
MKYLILTAICFFGLQSLAEDAAPKKTYKKTQEVSFDGSDVDGVVRSPDGAYLSQKKGMKFLPLYNVKKNFEKEVKSSVEYVR